MRFATKLARGCAGLSILLTMFGCSGRLASRDVTYAAPDSEIEGLPVRVPAKQRVEVFALKPDGTYERVYQTEVELPDQSRLFSVGIDADLLADHKLVLELNGDGTLKKADVTTTSKAAAALTQLGSSVAGVAQGAATLQAKRDEMEAARKAAEEAEQAARDAQAAERQQLLLAYRQALEAVSVQEARLTNPDLTAIQRAEAESQLRILKLQANQAARKLKRSAPYPEADQLP